MNSHQLQEQKIDYIIDTDIGGDIDDTLALLIAMSNHSKPLAITTNHIEPEEKAKIAKLIVTNCGYAEIPVYAGLGCKRTDSKKMFLEQNPLFPSMFGYPNPDKGDKMWYPNQAAAYKDEYGATFDEIKIEKESAAEIIVKHAKKYSPDNKLTIVALGPLHNLDIALKVDSTIAKNIKLFAMGGIYPKGYNWLISPEVTSRVISRLETYVVTNELIVQNKLFITPEELASIIDKIQSSFGKTMLKDWKNWHKADHFNKKNTNLYDPITLYLALHPHLIASSINKELSFPCLDQKGALRQSDFEGCWYFKAGLDDQIVSSKDNPGSHIKFINKLISPDMIKDDIIAKISSILTNKLDLPKEIFMKSRISLIKKARQSFIDSSTKTLSNSFIKVFTQEEGGKKYRIFGVKKEDQDKIDYDILRKDICKELEFKETKTFSQIIGDSSTFSELGTNAARKKLARYLSCDESSMMLYGWTGNLSKSGKESDANQLVSEWIDQHPIQANRFIANIVDEHTVTAIEKWGVTFSPHILNYYLVYTEKEPSVKFGDDTISSDNLTNHKVLCLEGGIQSLRQLIYMLNKNITIEGITDLRDDKNSEDLEKKPFLSAIGLLSFIKKNIHNLELAKEKDIKKLIDEYLLAHILYQSNRPDASTKEKLFQSAMQELYKNETWKKFSLFKSNVKSKTSKTSMIQSELSIFKELSSSENQASLCSPEKCKL